MAGDDGLITIPSSHSAPETVARLKAVLNARGVTVFAEIDHAERAIEADMDLRPTMLIVFGSPRAGTPLMQDKQRAGIDLPLKALIWEDGDGKVWLTYNDPAWLARRHALDRRTERFVSALSATLAVLCRTLQVDDLAYLKVIAICLRCGDDLHRHRAR